MNKKNSRSSCSAPFPPCEQSFHLYLRIASVERLRLWVACSGCNDRRTRESHHRPQYLRPDRAVEVSGSVPILLCRGLDSSKLFPLLTLPMTHQPEQCPSCQKGFNDSYMHMPELLSRLRILTMTKCIFLGCWLSRVGGAMAVDSESDMKERGLTYRPAIMPIDCR